MTEFIEILEKNVAPDNKILHKYVGVFDQDTIKKFANILSNLSVHNKKAQRRLFYVFVELGQNVGYYSGLRQDNEKKSVGIGNVIIYENN
ncbi:MAG: hypothetical protein U9Q83_10600, partial [Bacteroidota bacterium]|nr:hypothetical protein [Bacteroidota bacterium]